MTIKNLTRKTLISKKAKEANSLKDKILGLIFDRKNTALLIHTRLGIHTHLMSKPIDILVLDNQNRVVRLKEKLKPNNVFLWNPKYSKVIELRQKTISKTKTKLGDRIGIME